MHNHFVRVTVPIQICERSIGHSGNWIFFKYIQFVFVAGTNKSQRDGGSYTNSKQKNVQNSRVFLQRVFSFNDSNISIKHIISNSLESYNQFERQNLEQ